MSNGRSNRVGLVCFASLMVGPLSGCVDSLSFRQGSAGSEVGLYITLEINSYGDSPVTVYILQSSVDGGEVSFFNGAPSYGEAAMPRTVSCCEANIVLTAEADGQVRLSLFNVANSSAERVDELLLDVIDGVIYYAGGDPGGNSNSNANSNQDSSGSSATLTFSPLVPAPGGNVEVLINFAAPCSTDSVYEFLAGNVTQDAAGITIPAGETQGSMNLTRTTPGYARFSVTTNGCNNLTATHDLFFHGAGDQLFTGFAGPVTGSAGAEGLLEVQAEYITETVDALPQNAAYWNVLYEETSPENFTMALSASAAAYVGGGGGTFSVRGSGEYEWSLQPFTTTVPYQGALTGDFTLTRPDGTIETFSYSLPPKADGM